MSTPTVHLFGMTIARLRLAEAFDLVVDWALTGDQTCRYVVTPNVDHAVMFQHDEQLRAAYDEASLVVADGAPLIAASKLLGKDLPERVAGSDLAPGLLAAADLAASEGARPLRLFLLGAGPGVADRAAEKIRAKWPSIEVVGVFCPPLGFEHDQAENEQILATVNDAQPDVLLIGLGAPKQELWIHRFHKQLETRVALCAGATIDFLAEEKRRSPRWMQRLGLEWVHRLASEPRRLAGRYARDAWVFPRLVLAEWRRSSN